MTAIIKPTVGRVVWYFTPELKDNEHAQPLAAVVTYVHSDRLVNLIVFRSDTGAPFPKTSVTLRQEGDAHHGESFWCEWVPYQVGQAKKHAESPVTPPPRAGTDADGKAPLNFGAAIAALKAGLRVAREGWNGKCMWLALQVPDANSKMQRPYIYMHPADGLLVPWLASQTDMLAEDWFIVSP